MNDIGSIDNGKGTEICLLSFYFRLFSLAMLGAF